MFSIHSVLATAVTEAMAEGITVSVTTSSGTEYYLRPVETEPGMVGKRVNFIRREVGQVGGTLYKDAAILAVGDSLTFYLAKGGRIWTTAVMAVEVKGKSRKLRVSPDLQLAGV